MIIRQFRDKSMPRMPRRMVDNGDVVRVIKSKRYQISQGPRLKHDVDSFSNVDLDTPTPTPTSTPTTTHTATTTWKDVIPAPPTDTKCKHNCRHKRGGGDTQCTRLIKFKKTWVNRTPPSNISRTALVTRRRFIFQCWSRHAYTHAYAYAYCYYDMKRCNSWNEIQENHCPCISSTYQDISKNRKDTDLLMCPHHASNTQQAGHLKARLTIKPNVIFQSGKRRNGVNNY